MFAYTAQPNSPTDERLRVLASWAATLDLERSSVDENQRAGAPGTMDSPPPGRRR